MAKPISIFLIVVSLGGSAFAFDWKREVNGRWGFALTYPASLIPEVQFRGFVADAREFGFF